MTTNFDYLIEPGYDKIIKAEHYDIRLILYPKKLRYLSVHTASDVVTLKGVNDIPLKHVTQIGFIEDSLSIHVDDNSAIHFQVKNIDEVIGFINAVMKRIEAL